MCLKCDYKINTITLLGGNPGLVVLGDDSHSRVQGYESQKRILDGHF